MPFRVPRRQPRRHLTRLNPRRFGTLPKGWRQRRLMGLIGLLTACLPGRITGSRGMAQTVCGSGLAARRRGEQREAGVAVRAPNATRARLQFCPADRPSGEAAAGVTHSAARTEQTHPTAERLGGVGMGKAGLPVACGRRPYKDKAPGGPARGLWFHGRSGRTTLSLRPVPSRRRRSRTPAVRSAGCGGP